MKSELLPRSLVSVTVTENLLGDSNAVNSLVPVCQNLQSLCIYRFTRAPCPLLILYQCPNLRSLSLSALGGIDYSFLQSMPLLAALELDTLSGLTTQDAEAIGSVVPRLEFLSFILPMLSGSEQILTEIGDQFPNLKRLMVRGIVRSNAAVENFLKLFCLNHSMFPRVHLLQYRTQSICDMRIHTKNRPQCDFFKLSEVSERFCDICGEERIFSYRFAKCQKCGCYSSHPVH